MTTYAELRELRLGLLRSAESDWRAMANKLDNRKDAARNDLQDVREASDWEGEASDAAHQLIGSVTDQIWSAGQLAESVADLLSNVIDDFAGYQADLTTIVEAAPESGLQVSESGRVRLLQRVDVEGDGPTPDVGDPDQPRRTAESEAAVEEWQRRIDRIVDNANESDRVANRALRAVVGDEDVERFEGGSMPMEEDEDIEQAADAQRVVDLAQMDRDLTVGEAAQVAKLVTEHGEEGDFSDHVVAELGVEGLLELEKQVEQREGLLSLFGTSASAAGTGLANVLATATRVPDHLDETIPEDPGFQKWLDTPEGERWNSIMEETQRLGVVPDNEQGERVGYHDIVDFLEQADQPYSGAYLDGIAEDLIKKTEDDAEYGTRPAGHEAVEDTLLDRTFELASKDPDAATVLMYPGRGRLEFGLEQAENPPVEHRWENFEAPGLGNAIEAASTGRPAGEEPSGESPPPSSANATVAQHMVEYVTEPAEEDSAVPRGVPDFLTAPMAEITSHYIADINYAVDSHSELPRTDHGIDIGQLQAERLLKGVGEDKESFEKVMAAQQAYAYVTADHAVNGDIETAGKSRREIMQEMALPGSHVVGVLAQEQSQAAHEEALDPSIDRMQNITSYLAVTVTDSLTLKAPVISTAAANAAQDVVGAVYADDIAQNEAEADAQAEKRAEEISENLEVFYKQAVEDTMMESNEAEVQEWRDSMGQPVNNGFTNGWVK